MNPSSLALNSVWLTSLGKKIPQSLVSLPFPNLVLGQSRGLFYREGHVSTDTCMYICIIWREKREICGSVNIIPKANKINLKKVIFPLSSEKEPYPG